MSYIPQDDKERKAAPMFRGLLGYFPAALFEVARHSMTSDLKHNPDGHDGEPGPFWARGKSTDHEDCIPRHLIDAGKRGTRNRKYHLTALAWRALALLQEELEAEGATPGCRSKPADAATSERREARQPKAPEPEPRFRIVWNPDLVQQNGWGDNSSVFFAGRVFTKEGGEAEIAARVERGYANPGSYVLEPV